MYTTKSGQKFGSAFVGKKKDTLGSANNAMPMGESKADSRTNADGEALMSKANANAPDNDVKSSPEGVDPNQVVAEHGKAHTVHIAHDHKNKKHHVISTHESGHVHESEHASPKEAHDAASALAGAGSDQAQSEEPEAPESDGFMMPKLA